MASLADPFVGLLIYIVFAIVKPDMMWFWSVPAWNYSRVVAVGLLAGWVIRGCGQWDFGGARGVVIALIGYLFITSISAVWAAHPEAAWDAVENLAKIVVPFMVGITTINSIRRVKQLAWVIMLSQAYVAYEANLYYFSGYNRLWVEGFGGMDNNCNAIAFVTAIGLALFLSLETGNWLLRFVALAATLLLAHAILFSYSRGGMLALAIAGLTSFWLLPKRPQYLLMFAVAAAVVIRLAGPLVVERFSTAFATDAARDDSAQSRLILWGICWQLMLQQPLGVGADQFGYVVEAYGFPRGKLAHSLWMQVGAEVGFCGLGCLAAYYLLCIWRLLPLARGRRVASDPWMYSGARMVIAAIVGFAVSAQFVSLKNLEAPFYVALIGAIIIKLSSRGDDGRATFAEDVDDYGEQALGRE